MASSTGCRVIRGLADHLQHVGCRGLELQRFGEVAGLRLHFLEQPDIADGDYRLIGEGLQQLDLFVAEGMHFRPAKHDRADAFRSRAAKGTLKNAAVSPMRTRQFPAVGEIGAFRPHKQVAYMHRLLVHEGADRRSTLRLIGHFSMSIGIGTVMRADAKIVAVPEEARRRHGLRKARRHFRRLPQNGLQTSVGEEAITRRMLALPV